MTPTYMHTHTHTHTHMHTHTHTIKIYELVQACSRAMPHITTTTELPPRIPDFPTDTRSLVIHELYSTEYTYVKGLEVVDEVRYMYLLWVCFVFTIERERWR